ncbi:MAG: aldo/keto reductase [Candidatus Lokiarchaeota archaeon]
MGRTEISVSEIGLGGEWLNGLDKHLVEDIINRAVDNDINFFDFLFNELSYIKNIGNAIQEHREDIILQCHLGTGEKDGKPKRERNVKKNKKLFDRTLSYLNTNYVDIINIQFIREKEYKKLIGENGLLNLANQLKAEEKAHYIGASTHNINIGIDLAEKGYVDTIMFPINIANHFLERRKEFLSICKKIR